MLRGALLLCALGGCDIVFRVDHISPHDGGGTPPDLAPPDAFALCAQSFLDDSFDNDLPCDPWGIITLAGGASMTESGGSLVIQPAQNTVGSRGGCSPKAVMPFGADGAIAEVSHAIDGSDAEFTMLASGSMHLSVGVSNNQIVFQNDIGTEQYGTPLFYSVSSMRYWRIRPIGTSTVAGEYSADGRDWKELGRHDMTVPATASFGFLAGLNNNRGPQVAPDHAVYDRFVVCP